MAQERTLGVGNPQGSEIFDYRFSMAVKTLAIFPSNHRAATRQITALFPNQFLKVQKRHLFLQTETIRDFKNLKSCSEML